MLFPKPKVAFAIALTVSLSGYSAYAIGGFAFAAAAKPAAKSTPKKRNAKSKPAPAKAAVVEAPAEPAKEVAVPCTLKYASLPEVTSAGIKLALEGTSLKFVGGSFNTETLDNLEISGPKKDSGNVADDSNKTASASVASIGLQYCADKGQSFQAFLAKHNKDGEKRPIESDPRFTKSGVIASDEIALAGYLESSDHAVLPDDKVRSPEFAKYEEMIKLSTCDHCDMSAVEGAIKYLSKKGKSSSDLSNLMSNLLKKSIEALQGKASDANTYDALKSLFAKVSQASTDLANSTLLSTEDRAALQLMLVDIVREIKDKQEEILTDSDRTAAKDIAADRDMLRFSVSSINGLSLKREDKNALITEFQSLSSATGEKITAQLDQTTSPEDAKKSLALMVDNLKDSLRAPGLDKDAKEEIKAFIKDYSKGGATYEATLAQSEDRGLVAGEQTLLDNVKSLTEKQKRDCAYGPRTSICIAASQKLQAQKQKLSAYYQQNGQALAMAKSNLAQIAQQKKLQENPQDKDGKLSNPFFTAWQTNDNQKPRIPTNQVHTPQWYANYNASKPLSENYTLQSANQLFNIGPSASVLPYNNNGYTMQNGYVAPVNPAANYSNQTAYTNSLVRTPIN